MKNLTTIIVIFAFTGLFAQNNCLDFDGTDDYISTSNSVDISGAGNDITIEAWIYPESFQSAISFIAGEEDSNNGKAFIRLGDAGLSSNKVQFVLNFSGTEYKLNGNTELTANNWYHIAAAFNSGTLDSYIYINGIEDVHTYLGDETNFIANAKFTIGGQSIFGDRYFDGKIDEVRVWASARSKSEIRANMYKELAGTETGLTAYYNFNASSGSTLTDNSSNSNTATLNNMDNNDWLPSSALFGSKNCLNFDGTDKYVEISSVFGLGTTSVSGECWVNIPSTSEKGAFFHIGYAPGDNTDVGYGIGVGGGQNPGDGSCWDYVGNHLVILYDMVRWIDTGVNIGTGWHHTAFTIDALGNLTAYLDGVAVYAETGNQADPKQPTSVSSIGSSDGTQRQLSNGSIDEVRIWSDIRTETEIRTNMFTTLEGDESNLVAYYNFDNTSGTTLQDFSGNSHDGTLTNMTNSDWNSSSAFNIWLNTNSTSWATASNWSSNSTPISTDNIGIYNYSGVWPVLSSITTVNNIFVGASANLALYSNFTVNGNFFVYDNIDLNNNTITLGSTAYLFEESGIIYGSQGKITATRDLNNISAENIGGLGAVITTSANMGSTVIERHHSTISGATNSIKRYFVIEPTNNTNLNATLTFDYDETELNGNTENTLSLYRSTDNGVSWSDLGCTLDIDNNNLTLSGINHFSWWTATKQNSTLPITLINFNGKNLGHKNSLKWETESEINNKSFVLERSYDGKNFYKIYEIEGQGNSNIQNDYQFIDQEIQPKTAYYRLSNIDFDGKINRIKTIQITSNSSNNNRIFPNPSNGSISITGQFNNAIIYNSLGQKINYDISNNHISGLKPDTYIVIIDHNKPTVLYVK